MTSLPTPLVLATRNVDKAREIVEILVARIDAPVATATGLTLVPTATFGDCPQLDVICVPGGYGVNALLTDLVAKEEARE